MLAFGTRVRGFKPARILRIFRAKKSFLRRGSKAVVNLRHVKETKSDVEVATFGKILGLSPCDFDLIPKMKETLRGIRFRTVPETLQAVDRSIRTINTTGAAKCILRLPHRWQRVVHNVGDYTEGQ